jgi:multiple sugar transport system permease protein
MTTIDPDQAPPVALPVTPRERGRRLQARRRRGGQGSTATAFVAPSTIGLAVFTLFPILASVWISLHNWPSIGQGSFNGLSNYSHLIEDPVFRRSLLNTFVFVICYVPLNVFVSLGLAAWLSPRIKGRHLLRVLFFLPVVTPIIANAVVWRLIYQPNGLIDGTLQSTIRVHAPNFLGEHGWAMAAVIAMSVWQGFGYNMIVFSAAIEGLPQSVLDAAAIDGAGKWARFRYIVLPLITPSMFFATTLTLITAFQVFAQPFVLTGGGPGNDTQSLVMFIYDQGFKFLSLGLASAGAWILFVIILGVTALQFRGQKRWVHYDV